MSSMETVPASRPTRTLAPGDRAPDFELASASGERVRLSEVLARGKAVVLFFYPKDDSPGCTAEACEFRDRYDTFAEAGAEVIGVSDDDVASHARFAGKHRLQMPLVSDPGGATRRAYGVKTTLGLLKGRVTFVIDRDGIVQYAFDSQLRFTQHVAKALDVVRKLSA